MVRVVPQPPRTRTESLDGIVEVGQYDRVMAGVAAGRLRVEPAARIVPTVTRASWGNRTNRHLLGELIERRSPKGEHGDPVDAVDLVHALRVDPNDRAIEIAAADHHLCVIVEEVTGADVTLLHHGRVLTSAADPIDAPREPLGPVLTEEASPTTPLLEHRLSRATVRSLAPTTVSSAARVELIEGL